MTSEERKKVFAKLLNIKSDSINATERIKDEIYKEYDKISIDLNNALHDNKESENMLLEDGDVLTIEQNSNLVKVSGEVYYPTIVPYKENASLKYYIEKSGSYTELARKKGTLVIYPDGKAKKVKSFLLFKSYPEVTSRSEIFVPQILNTNERKVLKEMKNRNVKEILIAMKEGKPMRIQSTKEGLISGKQADKVRKILGLKNYQQITIDTRDEITFTFKKTDKKI